MSLGIIAKSLQHEHGCYLPSFDIDIDKGIKNSLTEILNYKDMREVSSCVAEYGLGSKDNGIHMLTRHMEELVEGGKKWGSEKRVFKLVITDVVEGEDTTDGEGGKSKNHNGEIGITQKRRQSSRHHQHYLEDSSQRPSSRFENLMDQVYKQLPKYYIHLPEKFNLLIQHKRLKFQYWQRRMVEFMKFEQTIDEVEPFANSDIESEPMNAMKVRIFCGFDPIRLADDKQQSALSLYIYSRRSGRLIKHEPDARNLLKLTAAGTEFGQGESNPRVDTFAYISKLYSLLTSKTSPIQF